MHKVTTMTEAETQAEIERIQDGAKSSFEGEPHQYSSSEKLMHSLRISNGLSPIPRKRGRPPGSKNKPKT